MPNDSIYFLLDHGLYCFNQMNQLILIDSLCGQYNSYIGDDGYIFRWTYQEMFYSNDYAKTFKNFNNKIDNWEEILFNDNTILYSLFRNKSLIRKAPNFKNQEINVINNVNNDDQFFISDFNHSTALNKSKIYFLKHGKLNYTEDNGDHWIPFEKEIPYVAFYKLFEVRDQTLLIIGDQYWIKSNELDWKIYQSKEVNYRIFKAQFIDKQGWLIFSSNGIVLLGEDLKKKQLLILKNEPLISELHAYSKNFILSKVNDKWQHSSDNGKHWRNIQTNLKQTQRELLLKHKSNSNSYNFYNYDKSTKRIIIYDNNINIKLKFTLPSPAISFIDLILHSYEGNKLSIICYNEILYSSNFGKYWKRIPIPQISDEYSFIFSDNNFFISNDSLIYYSKNFGSTWSNFNVTKKYYYDPIFCYEKGYLYWTEDMNYLESEKNNLFLYASPDFGKTKILVDSGYQGQHGGQYYYEHIQDLFLYNSDSIYLKAIQKGVITDQIPIMHNSFYHTPNWVTMGDNGYLYYTSPNCVLQRSKYRYKVNGKGKIIAYE